MKNSLVFTVSGVLLAVSITTAMDATGYAMFSALPLIALFAIFWSLQKFNRDDIGWVWGAAKYYGVAVGYPIVVLGAIVVLAYVFGAVDTSDANWKIALVNMALGSSIGVVMVVITEEGFFRGWLWASLRRLGLADVQVLLATSVIFTLWHVSAVSLDTGFNIPAREIPIYLTNATLLGVIFGLLRLASGSIVVASVCHAVWNAIAYALFGFGENVGELGIEATHIFGPEVGLVGIVFNLAVTVALWVWIRPAASGA
jgi:membrane protease YdiL (CAAX protease family)